ncbi:MAG: DmsE family decaheme c-type cytochrome, partial [Gallionellaceae bacterium]|nr:DmsE family decaheme c-type cytochrome [Gallionellaceae bacterium]
MIYLQKKWGLCLLIGCLGWVSPALAEDPPGRQNHPASPVAPAPASAKAVPAALSKDAACTKCHDENEIKPILSIYQTKHGVKADSRTPACRSCHGESEKHLHGDANQKGRPAPDILFGIKKSPSGSYAPSDTAAQNDTCLSCHRGEARMYWEGSAHQSRDVACVSCHEIHTAHSKARERETQTEICFSCHKEQRAQSYRASNHLLQSGKVVCSNCHNPHGSSGPKLLHKNTVNETCWTCHAEKRGPFLWEHAPVSDNCMNCHTPHGSNHASLLKTK